MHENSKALSTEPRKATPIGSVLVLVAVMVVVAAQLVARGVVAWPVVAFGFLVTKVVYGVVFIGFIRAGTVVGTTVWLGPGPPKTDSEVVALESGLVQSLDPPFSAFVAGVAIKTKKISVGPEEQL